MRPTNEKPPSKALHLALWIVQGLRFLAFGLAGVMKSTMPIGRRPRCEHS